MSMRERLHELIAESELSDSEAEVLLGRLQTWRDPVVRRFRRRPPMTSPPRPRKSWPSPRRGPSTCATPSAPASWLQRRALAALVAEDEPLRVVLSAPALRDLRRLDPPVRERIERALLDFAADPTRPGAVRPLVGSAPIGRAGPSRPASPDSPVRERIERASGLHRRPRRLWPPPWGCCGVEDQRGEWPLSAAWPWRLLAE